MPRDDTYGPLIDVDHLVGLAVAVKQSYPKGKSGSRLWAGMITVFYMGKPLFDIEGTLLDGREGPWFSWAQRAYEKDGQTKYKSVVWCHDKSMSATAAQAVQASMGTLPDDEPPF